MCTSYMSGANNPPTKKWCQLCHWNYTHVTRKCVHTLRMDKEREYEGQASQISPRHKQAKPILGGLEPPPPGVMSVKYGEPNF